MTSAHVRRLESRRARTAARFVDHASRTGAGVADLPAVKLPWYTIRGQAADEPAGPATVFIFDEIGGSFGVSAATFAEDLQAIDAPTIHVRINSPGGSVFDAIAMYNALNHHDARIVVYVDSLAASAASVVAMAGDEIVMMPGSQLMIHDASSVEDGTAADMAKMSTFLDRQSGNVADLYRMRGGGDVAEWRDLMLAETWMFAQEAVDMRLADRVEAPPTPPDPEPVDMKRSFDLSQYRYAGRRAAPAPRRGRRPTAVTSTRQRRAAATAGALAGPQADTRAAAAARRAAYTVNGQLERAPSPADAPCGAARMLPFSAKLRVAPTLVEKNGRQMHRLTGYATVFGVPYDMYDEFGPYKEKVNAHAGDDTFAAGPDVAFLTNHKGITMARTTNSTLELTTDQHGVPAVAFVNPDRQDVRDLVSAVNDELITEMSFAFLLESGLWNEDFTEFEIMRFDINRGDVSAVNYGANPYTSIAARSRELITHDLDRLPTGAARAAVARLMARDDVGPAAQGRVFDTDTSTITQAMGWFTAIDSIVDEAQESLAAALGVPNPDPGSDVDPPAGDSAAGATRTAPVAPVAVIRDNPEPAPPAEPPRPPELDMTGRSLDATAAWLAQIEADKLGARP